MEKKEPDSSIARTLGLFSVIVADLVGYTGAGVGLGYLVTTKWGFPWWTMLVTSITGLVLGMYRVYQLSKKAFK